MIWWAAAAWALEVRVYAPDAAPIAGQRTAIEIALADNDAPIDGVPVSIRSRRGRVLDTPRQVGPGRWRFQWAAPAGVEEDHFIVQVGERPAVDVPLALFGLRTTDLTAPDVVEVMSLDGQVDLVFGVEGPLEPRDVVVRATEGRVADVAVDARGLRVLLVPDARRDARILHVGVWDRRRPDTLPAVATVRLKERKSGTVSVEPNASVLVKVGGRTYGPFTADATGEAAISFDVAPGEGAYEVIATDAVGNSSQVTNPLGGETARPGVLLLDSTDEDRTTVMLAAWQPGGQVWQGPTPTCRAGPAERADAVPVGRGLWAYTIENPRSIALFDLRVECVVGESASVARLPIEAARPARIELRVWPQELDADFPIAQVQAVLLDARGDRLPVEGLEVKAEHGTLTVESTPDAVRADYQGSAAIAAGGDTLSAVWRPAASTERPWNLHLQASRVEGGIRASVRVHDRLGRPVEGADVVVEVADGGAPLGRAEGRSGPTGDVSLLLPGGGALPLVTAVSGGARGAAPVIPGVDAPSVPSLQDLTATLTLPVRAGRVRTVTVEVTDEPLATGDETGTPVRVRLFDLADRPIEGERVTIVTDYGSVVGWRAEDDGSWSGRYVPPRVLADREVHLTATADGSTGAASLRLVPRPVRGGVSIAIGYVANFGLVSSPIVHLAADWRMPFLKQLSVRAGGSGFWLRTSFTDEQTQSPVNLDVNFFPIEVGAMATQRWTRASLGGGVGALFVPYGMRATFDGTTAADGAGITSPGLQVSAEGAWRLGMSELFLNARGMIFPGPTGVVTLEDGPVHLAGEVGYRVLY